MQKKTAGFTLVEIMIVVAVIGLILTLAIPALLRTRLNTNQGMAETTLKTVSTAFETFRSAANPATYPADFSDLTTADPQYVELPLSSPTTFTKSGYAFELLTTGSGKFTIEASPVAVGQTGNRFFCIDASGDVVSNTAGWDDAATSCTSL